MLDTNEHLASNPYIVSYDKVNYARARHRRSADDGDREERIAFESHGRKFDLRLRRTKAHQFAADMVEAGGARPALDSLVDFYDGYVAGEPDGQSRASGAIIDGLFFGTVRTRDGHKYFVEPARKFNRTLDVHSIVYRERGDLDLDAARLKKFKRDLELARPQRHVQPHTSHDDQVGCASDNARVHEWMRKEQEALYNERVRTQVRVINHPFLLQVHILNSVLLVGRFNVLNRLLSFAGIRSVCVYGRSVFQIFEGSKRALFGQEPIEARLTTVPRARTSQVSR